MNRSQLAVFAAALLGTTPVCAFDDEVAPTPDERPALWATSLGDNPGLPNAWRVTDAFLRGAQPDPEGFASLAELGVNTVLNLRTFHSDRDLCAAAGLDYVKVSVQAWETEEQEILDVLAVLTDVEQQPVFLHCQHGADRTGTMAALYRMVVQGWSREQAIAEMTRGGYGFHSIWTNLVDYLEQVDVAHLRVALMARQQKDVETAVHQALSSAWREHIAAAQREDLDGVMAIYADDIAYLVGAVDLNGIKAMRAHEQASLQGADVLNALHSIDALRVVGDTAFEIGSIVGPVAVGGAPARVVSFHFMARWVRAADGRWRLQTLVGKT
jgi:ketosteroid isomerase-like protein/protein tyrosine phosphatase (PTP) superfamily phosphohydrolase (DUF442 family)